MTKCRFLGRACLEIISMEDHIIIDPHYFEKPQSGIKEVFITHEHDDHLDISKIEEIKESFSSDDGIEIYGPRSMKDRLEMEYQRIKHEAKIELNDITVTPYEVECYKSKGCYAYLISVGEVTILHTADSAKFSNQLKSIKNHVDFCFIACFEDYFENYLDFVKNINPKTTFPYHYNPGEEENAKKLVEYFKQYGVETQFLEIGSEFEF